MKRLLFIALLASNAVHAQVVEGAILAATVMQIAMDDKKEAPPAVVGYPVPVFQPQFIVMPQCTPNYPCTVPLLQCDTLPIVDQWGRIISYQKTCR